MAAKKDRVLWADDEIDLLKPHILFLQDKGYEVIPVISGQDAIECCKEESFDIIFLDENMPGLTGLETLEQIKAINIQRALINEEQQTNDCDYEIPESATAAPASDGSYVVGEINGDYEQLPA